MKQLLTILSIILITTTQAQQNFEKLWTKVEALEAEGKTQSAAEIVESIYKKATKKHNSNQLIKSLLYQSKYALILQEDAELLIANRLKQHISKAKNPATKAILQSILANFKWQYLQQHRWQIYQRTKTTEVINSDFRTWDLNTLFTSIHSDFKNSIRNYRVLQQLPIEQFNYIVIKGSDTEKLRPTLYDLLANRALAFFKTNESRITKPKERFYIDNEAYFYTSREFTELNFATTDSIFSQFEVLKTYQKIEQFHLKANNTEAYIDAYINRLNFVKNTFIHHDAKEQLYSASLKNTLEKLNPSNSYATVNAHYAQAIYNTSSLENHPEHRKQALDICNNIIKNYPKSEGFVIATNLKHTILQANFTIKNEDIIPINTPSKVLVNYQNIPQLHFAIYSVDYEHDFNQYNYTERDSIVKQFFKTNKPLKEFTQQLPQKNDYFNHSTEIVIPKLSRGKYIILATTDSTKNTQKLFSYNYQTVSNLACIESNYKGKKTLQIVHRMSGMPIENAKIQTGSSIHYTNGNGEITYSKKNKHQIIITHKDDMLHVGNANTFSYYKTPTKEKLQTKGFLFLDRSIYRPGQLVYFKGIMLQRNNFKSAVVENETYKVVVRDANYQNITTFEVTTNEFGSFSNHFKLPNNGLTGQFSISIEQLKQHKTEQFNGGNTYFSVEEYKRPKFEVVFQPITESYLVNQNICVKGNANALAGSNITNAKVTYRVVRKTQYSHWRYWNRYLHNDTQEIAQGTTTTNSKGEFDINFNALPDATSNKNGLPIFRYEITADVTDINGETRSNTTTVNVGYHSMTLAINTLEQWDSNADHSISISTTNLNHEVVPAEITVQIYKLKAPTHILRQRKWQAPDLPILSKEEFQKLFPYEAYSKEDDMKNWEKGHLVFEDTLNTTNNTVLEFNQLDWASGNYVIIAKGKDEFNIDIEQEKYITLKNSNDTYLADKQLFNYDVLNRNTARADGFVKLKLSTADKNLHVKTEAYYNNKQVYNQNMHVDGSKIVQIPFENLKHRSNSHPNSRIELLFSIVRFNTHINKKTSVSLAEKTESLVINTQTFRDKLQPGAKEKWSFTIKNNTATELLASMYDASLDQFKLHNWNNSIQINDYYYNTVPYKSSRSFNSNGFKTQHPFHKSNPSFEKQYAYLNNFGFVLHNNQIMRRGSSPVIEHDNALEEVVVTAMGVKRDEKALGYTITSDDSNNESKTKVEAMQKEEYSSGFNAITVRKNLKETAFFYPHLKTNSAGDVSFEFETPEALTRWKVQLFAHTKTGVSGKFTQQVVTQKELMVTPNPPRFLREHDTITFQTKIANLTDKTLDGYAKLELYDALTGNAIDTELQNNNTLQNFSISTKDNTSVSWQLAIPEGIQAVEYKVFAKTNEFSDGESNVLPVVTNSMLVTESIPITVRSNSSKSFSFNKLKNNTSTTLRNHQLTLEYTSNPAWYAIQSLPYLMEFPHECAEQTFSRYYANSIGSHILNSNPNIKTVFESWKANGTLTSKLEQNEELKHLLISETPWLRDAQSDTEKKKRLGLLFDIEKLASEEKSTLQKLEKMQLASGGFPWFSGGTANEYITRYIVAGFGHLQQLGITDITVKNNPIITKAVKYLDANFIEHHNKKLKHQSLDDITVDNYDLHYLYARSFFKNDIPFDASIKPIVNSYINKAKKHWLERSLLQKTMLSLVLHRFNDRHLPQLILEHLKETSITNEDKGMYWKSNTAGWYWHDAPIETQALIIEAFTEITTDHNTIEELQIWLLNNKRKNNWSTTKATTEATYALLLQGHDWLSVEGAAKIKIGNETIHTTTSEHIKEAGTGYFKTNWNSHEITTKMADISVKNTSEVTQYGGYYWQYFEQLDNITNEEHKNDFQLHKKLFLKQHTDNGPTLTAIKSGNLTVGDLVTIRIELQVKDNFEFVHLKDMRASTFEPIDVMSRHHWQDGTGYYQSTKDVATHFFFDRLQKGTYILEYDVRVNNAGDFSNGITTIQSMYAPEFTSHSKGVRVNINE
ncbi:MAG: alpha-2-macroglobulin family protein [Flavobacteriaceae bacterium]